MCNTLFPVFQLSARGHAMQKTNPLQEAVSFPVQAYRRPKDIRALHAVPRGRHPAHVGVGGAVLILTQLPILKSPAWNRLYRWARREGHGVVKTGKSGWGQAGSAGTGPLHSMDPGRVTQGSTGATSELDVQLNPHVFQAGAAPGRILTLFRVRIVGVRTPQGEAQRVGQRVMQPQGEVECLPVR